MKKYLLPMLLLTVNAAQAKEIVLNSSSNVEMKISIYNQSLALVKDTREADLLIGSNEVAFEGVAAQIKPETALLNGSGISVLEQNYEYDLLSANNILDKTIGKPVKTVIVNPENGKNIFDKAILLNSNYGTPILQFSYGIEANFPGRVVVDEVPDGLRVKPTLSVKLDSVDKNKKKLELNYLTNGLSWQADYVAEIVSDNELNWQAWVTIDNQSGTVYKDAVVQLIAGDVKQETMPVQPRMYGMMAKGVSGMAMDNAAMESGSIAPQAVAEYYIYNLPLKTTLQDKQSKQVSLLGVNGVKYKRLYQLSSPLYIGKNLQDSEFEKINPQVVYKLENVKTSNLGLPLPEGIVRFYEKDGKGDLQFTGATNISQLAVGEKAELAIGEAFDIFAKGKIVKAQTLSDKMIEAEVEITLNNAKNEEVNVELKQAFQGKVEVVKESLLSEAKKVGQLQWVVKVPANGETILKYSVRVVQD